jgi:hypothetical protein
MLAGMLHVKNYKEGESASRIDTTGPLMNNLGEFREGAQNYSPAVARAERSVCFCFRRAFPKSV